MRLSVSKNDLMNLSPDIAQNIDAWRKILGYPEVHRTLMTDYALETTEFLVGPGHYGSAMLIEGLSHIASRHSANSISVCNYSIGKTMSFYYTEEMRDIARRYYGEKVTIDATTNPNTEHTTARGLLLQSGFWITYSSIDETILGGMIDNLWIRKGQGDDIDLKDSHVYDSLGLVISILNRGAIRTAEKIDGKWMVNPWVRKAILMYLPLTDVSLVGGGYGNACDKIDTKYGGYSLEQFKREKVRIVPGSLSRFGAYLAPGVIQMPPSYVNIGAHVGKGTMLDSNSLVGSGAQVGEECHVSAGVQVGGVLEPPNATPVIIEDRVRIGGNCGIYEGVIVEKGSILAPGTILTKRTRIYGVPDERNGTPYSFGRVPAGSLVVPGSYPSDHFGVNLGCAVVVKEADLEKFALNDDLRK
ncbi:MAG: 2,3,4,5-tetrahydropyridine-2,6-dicarboxylate N-succinyltransferase [Candidatus Moranbacteria bacterium]|nr:2,3,4,5-tetrahydropyridine-2,6-dicarboxylate N-succinyltransferase [Candidatus Moranbacteria bacterium]